MVSFFGDYDTTETVYIPFNTFSSDDPSASVTITNLVAGDVEIHKDGGTTQRSSDAGVTVTIDFDSITGNHLVAIDLSDNTDAGFYAAGSRYQVRMEGTTVDGATINAWIGAFSIGCTLRPTTAGRTLDVTATGAAGIDWGNVENPTTAVDLSATDIQLCDTVTTNTDMVSEPPSASDIVDEWETQSQADPTGFHVNVLEVNGTAQTANDNGADINAILVDTNELQTNQGDWATATGFSTHSAADVADAVWDEAATGHTDAGKAGAQMWTDVDAILADTNELQTDDIPGTLSTMDGKLDTIDGIVDDILVDTGTTIPGTITTIDNEIEAIDTVVDAILVDTGTTLDGKLDTIDGNVYTILADTNELQTDDIPGSLATIATAIEAVDDYVDTEIAAILALLDDARAEPGQGAPPVNPDLATKIDYLYKAWRNKKTQDATTWSLFDDAGSTVDQKSTVSDAGGTATFGEIVSGP
jgi:hypothetical protein